MESREYILIDQALAEEMINDCWKLRPEIIFSEDWRKQSKKNKFR